MIVYIDEFDNDYHTITNNFSKEFDNLHEAEEWCKEESWSGYSYYIDKAMTLALNS